MSAGKDTATMVGQSFLLGPISLFSQWVTNGKMIHGPRTEQVIMALLGNHSQPPPSIFVFWL